MIKAVLLDLDDTLLHNPTSEFLAVYLQRLNAFFEKRWNLPDLKPALYEMGRALMFGPRDGITSNLALMLDILSSSMQKNPDAIHDAFNEFYQSDYLEIRACTRPAEAAPKLIERLKALGYEVVIATNPIYPAEAIRQRLLWAGLSGDFSDYSFVTTADNMHFAKPSPAYYAEILGRVHVEPDEAIMIGDHLQNDVIPAQTLGIHARHINADALAVFLGEIDSLESLGLTGLHPEMIEPQLRGNIGALYGLAANIKPHYWDQRPDPREWSPMQIICHLIEKETEAFYPRLEKILTIENPFIAETLPLGPDEFPPCSTDGFKAIAEFVAVRERTIQLIRTFSAEVWGRRARHSIFGNTTLLEMAHFTAQHDRLHLKQLCQTIGKCR